FLKLTDDLLDVAARAEPAAFAGDREHPRVAAMRQLADQVAEVGVDLECQGVEFVGAVQQDGRDALVHREVEVPPVTGDGCRRAEGAHAWTPPPSMIRV